MPRRIVILVIATLLIVSGCSSKPKQNNEAAQNNNTPAAQTSSEPQPAQPSDAAALPATPPPIDSTTASSQAPPPKANWKPSQKGTSTHATAMEKPAPAPVVIPAGTPITVRLSQAINAKTSKPGDTFDGTVAHPVVADGATLIPLSSGITGTVVSAAAPGKLKGEGQLSVKLSSIKVRGVSYPITTGVVSSTLHGKGKRSTVMIAGGSGAGALIGGLAGGGKGAAIGALVGGGAGTAGATMTGNEQLAFTAETALTFKLEHPLTLPPASASATADVPEQPTGDPQLHPRPPQ
jgi:hypothetical protein